MKLRIRLNRVILIAQFDTPRAEFHFVLIPFGASARQVSCRTDGIAKVKNKITLLTAAVERRSPENLAIDFHLAKKPDRYRDIKIGKKPPRLFNKPAQLLLEQRQKRRACITVADTFDMLVTPSGLRDRNFIDTCMIVCMGHWNCQVNPPLRPFDCIPILNTTALKLDVVEKNEDISTVRLIEKRKPRQILGLMDRNNLAHRTAVQAISRSVTKLSA